MELLPELVLSPDWEREIKLVERYIKGKANAGLPLQILEAGCGRQWPIKLDGVAFVLTGVDLDKDALEARKNNRKDLHEFVHGDLRTVQLPHNQFDVIYNAYVLEHISNAEGVLQNFVAWLKPGGIIILRIPDPESARGFLTRITPFWMHVLYYKYLLRYPNAGRPGYGPYETYYDPVVSRAGLRNFCGKHRLAIREERGDGYHAHGRGLTRVLIDSFLRFVDMLSGGKFRADHTNLLYVLEKVA